MKIALIFPRYRYPSGEPPIGIAYIAAMIRKHTDADVDIIDPTFVKDPEGYVKDRIKSSDYDVIGISLMTSMEKDFKEIVRFIRSDKKKAKIIAGGPHATILPEQTLAHDIDAVVIGEGEETFLEIVRRGCDFEGVKGVYYKNGDKIVKNEPRPWIEDLDPLPFPDRSLFDMEEYFRHYYQMDTVEKGIRGTSILASRGCPYRCTYCQPTLDMLFGKKIRYRSVDSMILELKFLKEKYGINAFGLLDDTFIVDRKWVMSFCDELIAQELNLKWQCNVRADLCTEDLLVKMRNSGLARIAVGVESVSRRILEDVYCKGITMEQVENTLRLAHRVGLKVHCYFMIGAPTETREEIMQTIRFSRNRYIDTATFAITTPLPKTYLHDKSKNMIREDADFDYYKKSVYKTPEVLPPGLLDLYKKMSYLNFYLTPPRLGHTISSFATIDGIRKNLLKIKRV